MTNNKMTHPPILQASEAARMEEIYADMRRVHADNNTPTAKSESEAEEAADKFSMTYAMPGMAMAMDESFLAGVKWDRAWVLEQAEKLATYAIHDRAFVFMDDLKKLIEDKR
jgi:hypothetical protein